MATDKRRFGVIETHRVNRETIHLKIDGQMWVEVEWSAERRCWCIQDSAGHCLTHVESIVGQDRDVERALKLARRMIVDGRIPTPEDAHEQLRDRQRRERLGEPLGEPFTMETSKEEGAPITETPIIKLGANSSKLDK